MYILEMYGVSWHNFEGNLVWTILFKFNFILFSGFEEYFRFSTIQETWCPSWMTNKVTRHSFGREPSKQYHERWQEPRDDKSSFEHYNKLWSNLAQWVVLVSVFYNRRQFWQLLFSQLIGGAKLLDLTMETSNKNFNGGNFIFYWFSNRLFCETR